MKLYDLLSEAINIELTAKNWGERLYKRLQQDPSGRDVVWQLTGRVRGPALLKDLIKEIMQWDPTMKKKYLLNWIIPKYISGGIQRYEDMEGVRENLALFDKNRLLLPVKDITQVPSASELAKLLRSTLSTDVGPEGKIIPLIERNAARSESLILFERDGLTVVVPLSQRAAGYWGRYSEWCTAYGYEYGVNPDRTSYFDSYNSPRHRLLIFSVEGRDDDLQCWYGSGPTDGNIQIMNMWDQDVASGPGIERLVGKLSDLTVQEIAKHCLGAYHIQNDKILLKYTDVGDFVMEVGHRGLRWAYDVITGAASPDWNFGRISLEELVWKKYLAVCPIDIKPLSNIL